MGSKEEEEIFIIGGESVYRESIPLADKIYLTEVEGAVNGGDVYFPRLDLNDWRIEIQGKYPSDSENQFGMIFKILHRKINAELNNSFLEGL